MLVRVKITILGSLHKSYLHVDLFYNPPKKETTTVEVQLVIKIFLFPFQHSNATIAVESLIKAS